MSAPPPDSGNGAVAETGRGPRSARELELLLEMEALRSENQHLRQFYARHLSTPQDPPDGQPGLPLPLHPQGHTLRGSDGPRTAQLEYEALFAALASAFPIGIFRTDATGVLTHVDESLQQIFGLQAQDFPNFGWLERVHPDDLERVRNDWMTSVLHGEARSVELRLLRPGAGLVHVLVRNTPMFDDGGRITGQLGFVQDITPLRELQADARIQAEFNRQIIASSPDCTKVLDLDGRVVQMTAQGCRLVEVDDFEQVRGSDWTQWWTSESAVLARQAVTSAARGENSRFMAFGLTFKQTPKWWDTMVSPINDERGQPVMLLVVSRDITEQHQQQEEIRQLNAQLESRVRERTDELAQANARLRQTLQEAQALYNQAPCGYYSLDRDGTIQMINQTALNWLGRKRADVVGHLNFRDLVDPSQLAKQNVRRLQLEASGHLEPEEVTLRLSDGRPFVGLASSTVVTDEQGRFVRTNSTLIDITERKAGEDQVKRANLQLQEALERSQDLYNHAPCGYHSLDINGIYVSINDTELKWLGYEREEVVGIKSFRDFILPSRIELLEDRLQRLIQDGVLEGVEYEMRRRDGTVFHALLSSSAVRDARGQFLRSNTTVVDITPRKAAEIALLESQRFLQTITDHVPGLIAYLDAMLCLRFVNAEHQRVFGLDPDKILGLHISECLPPAEWVEIGPRLQAALDGQTQTFESRRKTVHGDPIVVSTTCLPDIHEGQVQGVFVQTIDITDHKRIEQRVSQLNDELELRIRERSLELLESEQRFRLMVDNLREYCIFFLDAQGHITDWTDSAQRLEGYSPSEMLGRHYAVLFRDPDADAALASAKLMLRLAASRGQHERHSWNVRKDGSKYWSHSLLIALRDDGGELRGFAKINRDMTDAKRLDDLMRNINDELENRVAERTEQLLAANKDLESFSYSVSHDLRSPLRHISSFVSLLEEHLSEVSDHTTQRYLNTIGNSARHMSQLIDGLLAFSHLGRSAVKLTAVDFAMLVDAVVNQLAHDTDGRMVDWVIPPDLPVVQGDALLLREVWANLLGNAFKYTRPRERARIEIRWSVDPAVGYTFDVHDNGVGFDTQYAQKLFGVFQRLHRASEFEGTGIGLALTRRILERHGGSIWAESQVGEGSVFHFSLPFEGIGPPDLVRDSIPSALEP